MKTKIVIKKNAVKSVVEVATIETDFPIVDFTIVDDEKIYFIHGNNIGEISNRKINLFWSGQYGEVENKIKFGSVGSSVYSSPSSIVYFNPHKSLYVVENCGRIIRKIELQSSYSYSIIDGLCKMTLDKVFSKSPDFCKTSIDIGSSGNVYWTSEIVHRYFKFHDSEVSVFGNGRSGYSVCSKIEDSHFSFPNGICNYNNSFFITDTGNGCIRKVDSKTMSYVCGNLKNPRYIKKNSKNFFFIDDNGLRSISFDGKLHPFELYKSEKIINICPYNSDVYILESL